MLDYAESEVQYEFGGIDYSITEIVDDNGVMTVVCVDEDHTYPVALRANGSNVFHYKIGDDEEDGEWYCCTSRYQLIKEFTEEADERDENDSNNTEQCWNSSTSALLRYMNWV